MLFFCKEATTGETKKNCRRGIVRGGKKAGGKLPRVGKGGRGIVQGGVKTGGEFSGVAK